MNCSKCGAALREGAGFCSFCGQKVVQTVFCSSCGTELDAGDRFCFACGAAVKSAGKTAEYVHSQGRPAKKVAPVNLDASGFYKNGYERKSVSLSDRAIVFCSRGYQLCRVDKNMKLYSRNINAHAVAQTAEGVLAIYTEWNDVTQVTELYLCTMTDRLQTLSNKVICELPGLYRNVEYSFALDEEYIYISQGTPAEDAVLSYMEKDIVFTRIHIETEQKTTWRPDGVSIKGGFLTQSGCRLMVHEGKLYFDSGMHFSGEDEEDSPSEKWVVVRLDFESGECALLWREQDYREYGKPRFYDFGRGIMWTNPTEAEMTHYGWETKYIRKLGETLPLVPRKIAANAPILSEYEVCPAFPKREGEAAYFDGKKAYYQDHYASFYAIAGNDVSEDWNSTGHGFAGTAVVWQDKVIADLLADCYYTVYPAVDYKPRSEDCYRIEEVNCQ